MNWFTVCCSMGMSWFVVNWFLSNMLPGMNWCMVLLLSMNRLMVLRCRSRSWLLWSRHRFRLGLLFLLADSVRFESILGNNIILHLTSSTICVFREVSITSMIVLLLSVMTLNMMGLVEFWVFIVINSCVFIEIIIVRVGHGIVKVKEIMGVITLKVSTFMMSSVHSVILVMSLCRSLFLIGSLLVRFLLLSRLIFLLNGLLGLLGLFLHLVILCLKFSLFGLFLGLWFLEWMLFLLRFLNFCFSSGFFFCLLSRLFARFMLELAVIKHSFASFEVLESLLIFLRVRRSRR